MDDGWWAQSLGLQGSLPPSLLPSLLPSLHRSYSEACATHGAHTLEEESGTRQTRFLPSGFLPSGGLHSSRETSNISRAVGSGCVTDKYLGEGMEAD